MIDRRRRAACEAARDASSRCIVAMHASLHATRRSDALNYRLSSCQPRGRFFLLSRGEPRRPGALALVHAHTYTRSRSLDWRLDMREHAKANASRGRQWHDFFPFSAKSGPVGCERVPSKWIMIGYHHRTERVQDDPAICVARTHARTGGRASVRACMRVSRCDAHSRLCVYAPALPAVNDLDRI